MCTKWKKNEWMENKCSALAHGVVFLQDVAADLSEDVD